MKSDYELLYLRRQGSLEAGRDLYFIYQNEIIMEIKRFFATRFKPRDQNDCVQLAFTSLENSFHCFRDDIQCSLKTYISHVVKNRMRTLVQKEYHEKEVLWNAISLNQKISLDQTILYEDVISDNKEDYQPHIQLRIAETYANYKIESCRLLSSFEQEVIDLKLLGYSYIEIADKTGVKLKKVYNAIYRIQKKLDKPKSI